MASTETALSLDSLRVLVAEVLEVETYELTDEGDFNEDYDADSIRAIEILARIDMTYGIEIPQEDLPDLKTLSAVHAALLRHAGRSA